MYKGDIISIFILNYNDSQRTISLAEKVANIPFIDVVYVFDNGSNDYEKTILKNKQVSSKVLLDFSDANYGYNLGVSKGLDKLSKFNSKYVFLLNSDIDFQASNLAIMLDVIKEHNDIAVLGTKMIENGKYIDSFYNFPSLKNELISLLGVSRIIKSESKNKIIKAVGNIKYVDFVRNSFVLMDYNVTKNVNFFENECFLYFGEATLAEKLLKTGKHEAYLDNLFYYHNHIYRKNGIIKSYKIYYKDIIIYWKKYKKLNIFIHILFYLSYTTGLILRLVFINHILKNKINSTM